MDLDDLVSEGMLCFAKVLRKYPDAHEPRHLMALLKTVFTNRCHDLAEKASHTIDACSLDEITDVDTATHPFVMPDTSEALATMPAMLKSAMTHLATDPRALVTFLWAGGKWETPDEKLCRLVGVKPESEPLMEQVRAYLQEAFMSHRMV